MERIARRVSEHLQGKTDIEGKELKLWEKYRDLEHPDVFSHLSLAKDGGFSEVKDLYFPGRWLAAAVLLIFVVYNVESVVGMDLRFIRDPDSALLALGAMDNSVSTDFYFSQPISDWLLRTVTGDPLAFIEPVKVIGFLELIGLCYFFVNILFCLVNIKTDVDDGFNKWFYIQYVCWDILPAMSSYSAMKLLNNVVPVVLVARFFEIQVSVAEAKAEKKPMLHHYLMAFVWILTLVLSFIVGFDTFLMKLRVVSVKANRPDISFHIVIPVVQFLVQTLGVVQLSPFVRRRLFVFIFGGEDGIMQDEETELMETWIAMLAKRMYTDLPYAHFIAVMLSFSDEDFQSLVLNEDAVQKQAELVDV